MIDSYYKEIKKQFSGLIEEEKKSLVFNENKIHKFIEDNPTCILASVMNGMVENYNIYGSSIFSKIPIGGWERRVPDFILITYNSVEITFNLIEIEAPNRKIFTGANDFTSEFNHSYTQLEDWKRLFPSNSTEMVDKMVVSCFSDLGVFDGTRAINAKYILVYGSSDEYNGIQLKKHRLNQKFSNSEFYFISYDRLIRNFVTESAIFTLKYNSLSGGFKVIGWMPFLKYPLGRRREFGRIENKAELISDSHFLSKLEKEYLIDKIEELDKLSIQELEKLDMGIDLSNFDEEYS